VKHVPDKCWLPNIRLRTDEEVCKRRRHVSLKAERSASVIGISLLFRSGSQCGLARPEMYARKGLDCISRVSPPGTRLVSHKYSALANRFFHPAHDCAGYGNISFIMKVGTTFAKWMQSGTCACAARKAACKQMYRFVPLCPADRSMTSRPCLPVDCRRG
jgi:hypothetical protein